MRTRIQDYTIHTSYTVGAETIENCIVLNSYVLDNGLQDIRLIVNETQRVVVSSSMKKSGVSTDGLIGVGILYDTTDPTKKVGTILKINKSVCTLVATDYLTIEVDRGVDTIGQMNEVLDIINGSEIVGVDLPADYATQATQTSIQSDTTILRTNLTDALGRIGNKGTTTIFTELAYLRKMVDDIYTLVSKSQEDVSYQRAKEIFDSEPETTTTTEEEQ